MRRFLFALLTLLLLTPPALADDAGTGAVARPRIGLVLGGGGARGFAHVGVLQVLEENRIPVDVVAGTSMGAVVGSLYAQGKSPAELTRITEEIPWTTIFNDDVPRDRLSFRRKRDERDVLIDYRISFDDRGLVLPKGVLRGQDLFLTLAEYLAPARSERNFDHLAIPFRAVAGDLETGQAVVMGSGDIATAVFASMAVPGGLPPVERDGKLLVDGFIVDNVPVDVARSMGATRLIVVDVSTPLHRRDQISSFVSVIGQLQLLLGRENIDRQIATLTPADVLVRPQLDGIATTSFDHAEAAIAAGRAAAIAALDGLKAYALPPAEWQAYLEARAARAPRNAPQVTYVKFDNRSETPTRTIESFVRQRPGRPLDARRMTEDLQEIYALGGFRAVRYGIDPAPLPGGEGLTVTTVGDPSAANWLQVGLGIETDFNRHNALVVGLAYTDRNFLDTGAEWRTDIRVGTNLLFATGLYAEWGRRGQSPGEGGRLFAEITPYWSRTDTLLYDGDHAIAEVRDARIGTTLDGGILFGNRAELRFGTSIARVRLDTLIGGPLGPDAHLTDSEWHVGLTFDTLDQRNFPTTGSFLSLRFTDHVRWLGGDLDYVVVTGRFWKPFTSGRNTLLLSGEFGITSSGDGRSLGDFRLGGFLNLSGLESNRLVGRQKLLARAVFYRRITEDAPIISLPLYVGASAEVGNVWQSLRDISPGALRPAGSLFAGAETPLGPLVVATGVSRGDASLYLILGRIF